MKIIILGSGGFLPTPLPLCSCGICKNTPKRTGPSIYFPELELLIDTPENIYEKFINSDFKIKNILYSHWHPDHTAGYRIFEYLKYSIEKEIPIIHLNKTLLDSFKDKFTALDYFNSRSFIKINKVKDEIMIHNVKIKFLKMNNDFSIAYLIKSKNKNILICMDHSKDLIVENINEKIDLLIMNFGSYFAKISSVHKYNVTNSETDFTQDNLRIIKKLKPTKTIFLHIDPIWNLTDDDLKNIEQEYSEYKIYFSYDGMTLQEK
jgi:phosphoribosyl 1,2-cyclic phosphate phosphodiesterase